MLKVSFPLEKLKEAIIDLPIFHDFIIIIIFF